MISDDEPLDKKDITAEITGQVFDLDSMEEEPEEETPIEEAEEDGLNPVVGILDMLICSSPKILQKYGYPSPDLEIWEDWGKENLSKAFNEYMPDSAGTAVSSPLFCGVMGAGALVFAFLPVILHFIDKQGEEKKKALEEAKRAEVKAAEEPIVYENTYETPAPPSGIISTAPVSMGTMTALEKFKASGEEANFAGF